MNDRPELDPVHESDRIEGSTPPERGVEGTNVVGRPPDKIEDEAYRHRAETAETERADFDDDHALESGGSFDGLGVPVVER